MGGRQRALRTKKVESLKMYEFIFLKVKNFYSFGDMVKKVKRQTIDQEKVFSLYVTGKEFLSRFHK